VFKEKNDYHTEIPAVFSFSLLSAARAAATDGADVLGFQLAFHHFLAQWTALLRIGTQHP